MGVVVRTVAVASGGAYLENSRSISLFSVFLWSYKDFRNNVVVIGVSWVFGWWGCVSSGCGSIS